MTRHRALIVAFAVGVSRLAVAAVPDTHRWRLRVAFLLTISISAVAVGAGWAAAQSTQKVGPAPPGDGMTAITGQGMSGTSGYFVVFDADGETVYRSADSPTYYDVDPVPGSSDEVIVVSRRDLKSRCTSKCYEMTVSRVDLSTGHSATVYREVTTGDWHDVDILGPDRLLVAGIGTDSVFVLNTTTGLREWSWWAESRFDPQQSGGRYPEDWTHVNDVEMLEDGRRMASLRNHDQVVFLHDDGTLDEDWTLGEDGDHDVLFEQHNPDYIPADRGGPAVVVADSENNRIVEYERRSGRWVRTWEWADATLSWPRDADRLPNGNTLIADSHGGRVIEVDSEGEIVWSVPATGVYEAERLGTGDESAGGPSASRSGLASRSDGISWMDVSEDLQSRILDLFPQKLVHAGRFITPGWVGLWEFLAGVVGLLSAISWIGVEVYWSSVRVRSPFVHERGDW